MEHRPWGSFEVLGDYNGYSVKRLMVSPGQRISYQSHECRAEYWVFVEGNGAVRMEVEGVEVTVEKKQGDVVFIPVKAKHQIINNGLEELVIVETWLGNSSEDDIVRYEDPYNR